MSRMQKRKGGARSSNWTLWGVAALLITCTLTLLLLEHPLAGDNTDSPSGGGRAAGSNGRLDTAVLSSQAAGGPNRAGKAPAQPRPMPVLMARPIDVAASADGDQSVRLCQSLLPVICGVDCQGCSGCGEAGWDASRPIPWEVFAQGEYIGPARTAHVPQYRLRVDDQLEFIYRFTHEEQTEPYRFGVGDSIVIESLTDPGLNRGDLVQGRGLEVQPDGTVTLPLLGQVPVARRTVEEVRRDLERRYSRTHIQPSITVTPLKTNTKLEDLRATVDGRFGQGGQSLECRVTPEGTIQLPAIGSVPTQRLTLGELQREVEERYLQEIGAGVEVTARLVQRAPRSIYVAGEVANPGRYQLNQPTTAMGAIALAGGWNVGGNLREVVVFRRAEDWRLVATRLDIRGALLGKRPCPADEIWLRDSDIVVVPKTPLLLVDDFINLFFTRGVFGVVPITGTVDFSRGSRL